MALVVHEALTEIAPGQPGIGPTDCLAHITSHSLQPTIQFSIILRNLLSLSEKLRLSLEAPDADGVTVIDAKSVQAYLKVTAEIREFYRTGGGQVKLMFDDAERLKATQPMGKPGSSEDL